MLTEDVPRTLRKFFSLISSLYDVYAGEVEGILFRFIGFFFKTVRVKPPESLV